ncbi:hypothetical protein B0J17DRAFT_445347 [Rhizoctonia solani]|nr:hypothetical protein B0J17DRAFT_445347 [Rhizoctonia solani]
MYRPPGQKNEPTEPIPISCRFVATDQWFRTHVCPDWTISQLKRHLLARCNRLRLGTLPLHHLSEHPIPRLLKLAVDPVLPPMPCSTTDGNRAYL